MARTLGDAAPPGIFPWLFPVIRGDWLSQNMTASSRDLPHRPRLLVAAKPWSGFVANLMLLSLLSLQFVLAAFHLALGERANILLTLGAPILIYELAVILFVAFRERTALASVFVHMRAWLRAAGLALLTVAFATAMFAAVQPYPSLMVTLAFLIHALYGFSVAALVTRGIAPPVRSTGLVLVLAMVAYLPLLVGFVAFVEIPVDGKWANWIPGFRNIRHMGHLVTASLAAAFGLLAFTAPGQALRRCLLLTAVLLWAMLFWSGSRTGLLAFAVGLAVTMAVVQVPDRLRFLLQVVVTMAIGAVMSTAHTAPHTSFGMLTALERSLGERASSGRVEIWLATLEMIRDRPWFGYGAGQFKIWGGRYGFEVTGPHNLALQFLFDWGVVGASLCSALLLAIWFGAARRVRENPADKTALFFVVNALIASSFVDTSSYRPHVLMIVAMCFALLLKVPSRTNMRSV